MRLELDGTVGVDPSQVAHLTELLARDPAARGTAASILNREGERMRDNAQRITRNEIRDRSDERRTAESKAHGATYYESWKMIPAKLNGYALEIVVYNDHPFAKAVENGTPEHVIVPRNAKKMTFPFNAGAQGSVGHAGAFAVEWSEGGRVFLNAVKHPGATGHHIMERALMEWRSSTPLRRAR